ncbi:MAG: hypothetical protein R3D00_19735 [Bacteroidia bacterium]
MYFSTLPLSLFLGVLFTGFSASLHAQWHNQNSCDNPWILCEQVISLPVISTPNTAPLPPKNWRPEQISDPWQQTLPQISGPSAPDPWENPFPVSGGLTVGNGFNMNKAGFLRLSFDPAWREAAEALKPGTSFKGFVAGKGLLTFTLMAKVDRELRAGHSFELSYLVSWKTEDGHSVKKPLYIFVREQGIYYLTER